MTVLGTLTTTYALALLFAIAAAHKLATWQAWIDVLRQYALLPPAAVPSVASFLPICEATIAVGLVLPGQRHAAAAAGAGLLLLYAGAMAANLRRGRNHIDCGCFGGRARRTLSQWMPWRNVALSVCTGLLTIVPSTQAVRPEEVLVAVPLALTSALLYAATPLVLSAPAATGAASRPRSELPQ